MLQIETKEIEISEDLKRKIEMIGRFSNTKPIIKNGSIRNIKGTNIAYVEPHQIFIKNNKVIMKVKNQTKRRFKRKMENLYRLLNNKKIEYKELSQIKDSYLGHLNYGNTKKMIEKTLSTCKTQNSNVEVIKAEIVNSQIIYR